MSDKEYESDLWDARIFCYRIGRPWGSIQMRLETLAAQKLHRRIYLKAWEDLTGTASQPKESQ